MARASRPASRTRSTAMSRRRSASAADSGCARPSSDSRYVATSSSRIGPGQRSTWPEQHEARLLRPVQVVEHHHRRPVVADRGRAAPATASSSRNRSSAGAGGGGDAGQDPRQRRSSRAVSAAAASGGIAARYPPSASTHAWYGTSASSATRPASTDAPARHARGRELGRQPRLADAGLASHEQQAGAALADPLVRRLRVAQLRLPPDQRRAPPRGASSDGSGTCGSRVGPGHAGAEVVDQPPRLGRRRDAALAAQALAEAVVERRAPPVRSPASHVSRTSSRSADSANGSCATRSARLRGGRRPGRRRPPAPTRPRPACATSASRCRSRSPTSQSPGRPGRELARPVAVDLHAPARGRSSRGRPPAPGRRRRRAAAQRRQRGPQAGARRVRDGRPATAARPRACAAAARGAARATTSSSRAGRPSIVARGRRRRAGRARRRRAAPRTPIERTMAAGGAVSDGSRAGHVAITGAPDTRHMRTPRPQRRLPPPVRRPRHQPVRRPGAVRRARHLDARPDRLDRRRRPRVRLPRRSAAWPRRWRA